MGGLDGRVGGRNGWVGRWVEGMDGRDETDGIGR